MSKFILVLLLLSSSVFADDFIFLDRSPITEHHFGEWTKQDTYREATFDILLLADYSLSLDIKNHPNRYEQNRILGTDPSDFEFLRYNIIVAAIHPLIAYALPKNARKIFQYISIGVEVGCIYNNLSLGLKFQF